MLAGGASPVRRLVREQATPRSDDVSLIQGDKSNSSSHRSSEDPAAADVVVVVGGVTHPAEVAEDADPVLRKILGYQFPATPSAYAELQSTGRDVRADSFIPVPPPRRASDSAIPLPPFADIEPEAEQAPAGAATASSQVRRQSTWEAVANAGQMAGGIFLKTVVAIFMVRQVADVLGYAMQAGHDMAFKDVDPNTADKLSLILNLVIIAGQAGVCGKLTAPTISTLLSVTKKDKAGQTQLHEIGGAAHGALIVLLSQITTAVTVGRALDNCWHLEAGAPFNAGVFKYLNLATRTLLYCGLRGIAERPGARTMPARTVIDAQGNPLSAEKMAELTYWRAAFMAILTIPNALLVAHTILHEDYADTPGLTVGGIASPTINFAVGFYEALVCVADLGGLYGAAWKTGGTVILGNLPPAAQPQGAQAAVPPPPLYDPPLPADAVRMHIGASVESIDTRDKTVLESLRERPSPDLYAIIFGLRAIINLLLNWTMRGNAGNLELAAHALGMGMVELVPLRLENGIAAQAIRGTADADLADKLHVLFQMQDLAYLLALGGQPADASVPIIRRRLDDSVLALIEKRPAFDDVRAHLKALMDADLPRHTHPDPNTAILLQEPRYPPQALVDKFGKVIAATKLREGSRVTSSIRELVASLTVPPPPPDPEPESA